MSGFRCCLIFVGVILYIYSFSQSNNELISQWNKSLHLLKMADDYASHENAKPTISDRLYQKALDQHIKVLGILKVIRNDSISICTHNQLGFLYYYFDSTAAAKDQYLQAIQLNDLTRFQLDSSFFLSYIFVGSIFYRENVLDSALYYFKKAEKIYTDLKTPHPESQRLYNWLGGLYYETGNYKQAINYFEKARSLLKPSNPYARDLTIRYENNIASAYTKMEQYAQADTIYTRLIAIGLNTNELINNRGIVNLKSGNYTKALEFFKTVTFENELKITLFNNIGYTYAMLQMPDSAEVYYRRAMEENTKWNFSKKNSKHGYTWQNIGKLNESKGLLFPALVAYQEAMIQFYPSFANQDIYANPDTFSGIFSYLELFNVLVSKGEVFEKLFLQTDSLHFLDASLHAYTASFRLVHYVDQMYDSDDARLFLNKIKYSVHDKPIQLSLEGYNQTHQIDYLTKAYHFDQENKASILSHNAMTQNFKSKNPSITALFDQERILKTNITRLHVKSSQIRDSSKLSKLNSEIRDAEIELSKIQLKKNEYPQFKSLAQNIPGLTHLQSRLGANMAVISYHLSKNKLVSICISKNEVVHTITPIDSIFYANIDDLKQALDPTYPTSRYSGQTKATYLYDLLIRPLHAALKNKNQLILIPDDELNSIPFEVFQDENGNYLIEKYIIHYQYSTALLLSTTHKKKSLAVLAMAPFVHQSDKTYGQLKYSGEEIETLEGNILINQLATKEAFLNNLNKFPILHLATHTYIDEQSPDRSHIAFSPGKDSFESKIFLPEIYNLTLDSTSLVILSACETAHGKLAKGEGLMSMSRAFYYAGCRHIIASLWKADDQSTAWILKTFYTYLHKGYSISNALRKAKLDYLNSTEIEGQYKTPYYWSHLILTGQIEDNAGSLFRPIYIAVILISLFLLLILIKYLRK